MSGINMDVAWAERITKSASLHTYYTIRFLVDRGRVADAYRAYGYFRWLDDQLDQNGMDRTDRLALVERQQQLIAYNYRKEMLPPTSVEEQLIVDLIRSDVEKNSGLRSYIQNMMTVMEFDAGRRGRFISEAELRVYTHSLSVAVTEALHYFIGHGQWSPHDSSRYLAVTGAHITHMLRDTQDDLQAGYYNIPREYLEEHRITPNDTGSDAYRAWVKDRVRLARTCFQGGKEYLKRVRSLRYRLAGYAYMRRFERVLARIKQEEYRLHPENKEYRSLQEMQSKLQANPFNAFLRRYLSDRPGQSFSNYKRGES